MGLIEDIKRDREDLGIKEIDTNTWRVGPEKGARNSFRSGERRVLAMEAALLAAEELATDLSICADNAAHAAKTDPRWEGVAEKLRARLAAYREATA